MAAQTSYSETMTAGLEGMIAESDGGENIISRTIEDAAGIGFGKIAVVGEAGGVVAPTEGGIFEGITVRTQAIADGASAHAQYDTVSLLRRGVIWVVAGEAVTAGAKAYWTADGAIVDSPDDGGDPAVNHNEFPMPARFETAAAEGALVKLRLG